MTVLIQSRDVNAANVTLPSSLGGTSAAPVSRLAVPIDEAAELVCVSYNTLWRAVHDGQFAGVRIRDRIVIPVAAFSAFRGEPLDASENDARLAVSLREAAKLISVSYNTLWRALADEQFPATRIRSRIIVSLSALHALMDAAVQAGALIDVADWTTEWRASLSSLAIAV